MSREDLLALASDLDRIISAGSTTALGADKLRQRAKIVRELSQKVPGLVPVAGGLDKLLQATPKTSGSALLDLVVMAQQIRRSLTAMGIVGDSIPPQNDASWKPPLPTKEFRTLYEAITKSGGNREEVLREAIEKSRITDLRLVDPMLESLNDGNTEISQLVATQGLPAFGKSVLPDLLDKLNLKGKSQDGNRLLAICKIDPKLGREYCLKALNEGSIHLKVQALQCFPEVGEPGEAEKMGLQMYKDKSREVRIAALASLKQATSEEALNILLEAIGEKDYPTHSQALESLTEMTHSEVSPQLIKRLTDHLQKHDEAEKALTDVKKEEKKNKATKKGKGKKKSTTSSPGKAVLKAEENLEEIREVCGRLIHALSRRKDKHRLAATKAILPLFEHSDEFIRTNSIEAMGFIGPETPDVLKGFERLLQDKDLGILDQAIYAINEMDPKKREPLLPSLFKVYGRPKISDWIKGIMFQIYPPHFEKYPKQITQMIRDFLKNPKNIYEKEDALDCIKEIGAPAASLLPDVLNYIKTGKDLYYDIDELLPKIDESGKKSIPALIKLLSEKKADTRSMAAQCLGAYGPRAKEAIPHLEKLLKDKNWSVRYHIESALSEIQS